MTNKTLSTNDNSTNFSYKQVLSGKILSDSYQRPVNANRVARIVGNFNPLLVNPIKVSYRDGKYYVFDGQHTLFALVKRNNDKSLPVECKVYTGLTKEDEARLFSEQNGISQSVTSSEKVSALYISKDVDVVEMKEMINGLGITFDFSKNAAEKKIVCVSTVYEIMKNSSCDKLKEILEIIIAAWGGENGSLRQEIIKAVYLFDKTYKGQYSKSRFIQKMKAIPPVKIIRNGNAYLVGGVARYSRQMLIEYNRGLKTNRLDDTALGR